MAEEAPKKEEVPKQDEAAKKDDDKEEKKEDKKKVEEGNWLALELKNKYKYFKNTMTNIKYRSNPGPLNKFAKRMGLPDGYEFCDIFGLDAELLAFVPKPCLAVMLLFPSSKGIKDYKAKQQEELTKNPQKIDKDLFYLYQHDDIGNACGTIAMIHALSNVHLEKNFELKKGALSKFMTDTAKMDWTERGWALLKAKDIQEQSESAANDDSAEDGNQTSTNSDVNAHFIAFIRKDAVLWELDGRKKFPVSHGKTSGGSFLTDVAKVVKEKFMAQDPNNVNFNLMGLAPKQAF